MRKLQRVAALVEKLGKKLHRLTRHGFYRRDTGSASRYIWVNPKIGVVVKRPLIVRERFTIRLPPRAIPTVIVRDRRRQVDSRGTVRGNIFIQPLINMRSRNGQWRAKDIIERDTRMYNDVKNANVGWYRGKAVLIDW